ncbi:MAG: methyltransferase domain-containing protein [Planctomycetota bacterium]
MTNYDAQTINSKNPLARFSHRTRVRNSIRLATKLTPAGQILDYGCGSGVFIQEMNSVRKEIAFGYEPFMEERTSDGLPIFRDFADLKKHAPFSTVTLFETIEHLSDSELGDFLKRSSEVLEDDGCILVSAPIEVGPALLMKELNRSLLKMRMPEHRFLEFINAAFFGVPARRAINIKGSHRGFDFRTAIKKIEDKGWVVSILKFSPLPLLGWYGNSQVFFTARKVANFGG